MKLLVIADDFTGALDTGVQFKAKHTLIRVREGDPVEVLKDLPPEVQVLIIDAETRHMPPAEAYQTVYTLVAEARKAGVGCIYKKTDSALRGNIGSELAAALDASGETVLHFVPAFPGMNRKTEGGIHYIDGRPVAESVFGRDAFEPVRYSAVADIIAAQSPAPTHVVPREREEADGVGIWIYDASTEADLRRIAGRLQAEGRLKLVAGCAGFAAMLPELLALERRQDGLPELEPSLLMISGSINPITVRQLEAAERSGIPRISLLPDQKLDAGWLETREGRQQIEQWLQMLWENGCLMVECGRAIGEEEVAQYEARYHIPREDMRARIADTMGSILKRLLDMGAESTVMITGGDTLLAFMQQIHVSELADSCEILPGVALSKISYRGREIGMISKSGGFGDENLFIELHQTLRKNSGRVLAQRAGAC